MRISDWSSDVCSSDLLGQHRPDLRVAEAEPRRLRAHTRHSAGDAPGPPGSVRLRAPAADVQGPAPDPVRRPALGAGQAGPAAAGDRKAHRSEEHTSELQSLMRISYAVFCLKKKKHTNT